MAPSGLAMPRPATSGAEPWMGSEPAARSMLALGRGRSILRGPMPVGQDVAEHVAREHDVELRALMGIAHESTSAWRSSTSG
jgi:hypothetical protein